MSTTRRQALKTLAAATLATTSLSRFSVMADTPAMPAPKSETIVTPSSTPTPPSPGPYTLPPLAYDYAALEPMLDAETMHLHHDTHHAAYVTKLNEAVLKEPSVAKETNVDNLLKNLSAVPESIRTAVRNYGGGHSNHSLLWQTLSPQGGGIPPAELTNPMSEVFVSFENFKVEVAKAANKLFGSGWVWLVLDSSKKLSVMTTANQDSPLSVGKYPLLGFDFWEHAYYLRFHNSRVISYFPAFLNVVDWKFVTARYLAAMKG